MNKQQGVNLIELMIVVVIVSILAAIAIWERPATFEERNVCC
jgi:prepilin-type N-terminal cleavage/methylation domain-containing protein